MAAKKKNKLNINLSNIKARDLKPLGVPVASLLGIIAASFIVYRITSNQVNSLMGEIKTAKKNNTILDEKINVLSQFSANTDESTIQAINAGIPENNSSLMMLAQIKSLASGFGLNLTNLTVSTPIKEKGSDLFRVDLQFDLDGSFEQIIPFLAQLKSYAPVNNIQEVEFVSGTESARGTITITVYYAELPQKIPAITDPVVELNAKEMEILSLLEGLGSPVFVDQEPTNPDLLRTNPFE